MGLLTPGTPEIKLFTEYENLEDEVNQWLVDNKADITIISIQHSCVIGASNNKPTNYVMIYYITR